MAKTWDTSRTGGGTYEFTQDAQGNYTLGSVGFDKISKLNLPELKKESVATTTTTDKKDTAALSSQTKQAFGDVQPFYYNQKGGGGADQSLAMTKDKSLTENLRTDTKPPMLGDTGGSMVRDTKPEMLGDTGGSIKKDTTPAWAKGVDTRGYENIGKEVKPTNQIGRQNVDQVLAARQDPNRFTGIVGPQKQSPYQDAIMRGETGVKYEKPGTKQEVSTQLKQIKTALSPLAKAVGFVMNPVKGLIGAAVGMAKDTPTQSHARKYFNTRGDNTGRIAGNPATDLYAGMNQTSAFGNLERSGERRIETREKTIEKKGYGPGDKFYDDTQKMKGQQKDYKNDKDNNVVDKGFTRTRAERKANPGRQDANTMSGGGGNGGGGGGRVICTELHRTHELSTKDWVRDIHFTFNTLTENHIKGYLIWAIPTVEHMKKYPKYRKFWKHVAQHRANDIAWRLNEGKFDLLGRIYAGIGEPLCWLIGNFTGNKQINELNIKNWRKA
jgi:hypothetical protein